MEQIIGKQSVEFENPARIIAGASIVGKKEGEGPLGSLFDIVGDDYFFGEKTWELAEGALQREAAQIAIGKANLKAWQIRYVFSGDLLEQIIATTFGLENLQIPLFGIYGACSTVGEGLSLASMVVGGGFAEYVLVTASSHFGSAEKQFRFPLSYANQRPLSTTYTVTGSGAFVLAKQGGKCKITGITTGKVVDFGVEDSMNMGASMAPAACDTIYQNFMDFNRTPQDYDKIITGDLGYIGQEILIKLLKDKGFDISQQHTDCGIEIYDKETQDTHSGGSGCGCAATTLSAYILPKIESGEWKRVLFVPTGALLSKISFNEGEPVPGIAHGVVLEHC